MNKNDLISQLATQKVKDYTFTIVFFLVFSFFILFAIRPNLVAVVTLREEIDQLKTLNQQYENNISRIIELQSVIEQNRENFAYLTEALPGNPQVNKVIDDIKKSASDSALPVDKISVNDVSLKASINRNKTKQFTVNIETDSDFLSAKQFIDKLFSQRRLKTIKNLSMIKQDSEGSGSAKLKISIDIDGYYL